MRDLFRKKIAGLHTGLLVSHTINTIYFCPQDVYKNAIITSALCFESPAFCLQLQQRLQCSTLTDKYFSSATEFADRAATSHVDYQQLLCRY
jgi:hypothetical protein